MNAKTPVNNVSNVDTAMLWGGDCNSFTAQPILPNTTDSRVCGYRSQDQYLMNGCCGGTELQLYQCWTFCKYPGLLESFTGCLNSSTEGNYSREDVFCQSGLQPNLTESLKTSFGFRSYSAPKLSWMALSLVFAILFVGPTSASMIPSLAENGIARRQTSACTFSKDQSYYSSGRQYRVSNTFICDGGAFDGCPQTVNVETGFNDNNRTINGTSASDTKYDQIFEIISNATGRAFPAQSSLQVVRDFVQIGSGYLTFSPLSWCINGTVSNCQSVIGDSNAATYQEFCGPTFASDVTGKNETVDAIQGAFIFVNTE